MARVDHVTYANVVATLALFVALGGTSYAVLHIRSGDVVDNSLRSRDVRNNTLRSRDIRERTLRARDLGGTASESGSWRSRHWDVPRATEAERLGGVRRRTYGCGARLTPVAKAGVCIETSSRTPDGFLGAIDRCNQARARSRNHAATRPFCEIAESPSAPEWTSSVYRNTDNGPNPFDELEAVCWVPGATSYDRVYQAVQHPFRCVALPSN